jgi:hypothetical protein
LEVGLHNSSLASVQDCVIGSPHPSVDNGNLCGTVKIGGDNGLGTGAHINTGESVGSGNINAHGKEVLLQDIEVIGTVECSRDDRRETSQELVLHNLHGAGVELVNGG